MHPPLQLALEHHQAGRLSEAEKIYRQILGTEPDNADALHFLGLVAHQVGKHEEAIELIEKAHRYARPSPLSLNSLGLAYLASNRPREAKRCFTKALALKPDYAEAHSNLGAALHGLGQPKDAERSYRRALAIKPDLDTAHYNFGSLLSALGRWEEAERSYREALAHQPNFADAWSNLGLVLASRGRVEEAEACYREAIRIDPRHLGAHHHLARALRSLGRPAEAEQSYRAALALNPDMVETLAALADVVQDLGRYDEAEKCHERLLALRPDLAEAHYNLGNARANADRQEDARRAFRQAIAIEPDFAAARWALTMSQLPMVYDQEGDPERCRAAYSEELDRLLAWFESNPSGDADAIVVHPFRLAYQEQGNRELLARSGKLSAGIMHRWLDKQRIPTLRQPKRGAIRIGVVSAQVYAHSVWGAIVKGWLQTLDRDRFELDVFHLGRQRDPETAFAESQASHFEQGPRPLREWVQAIAERQPAALIYPEIGMNMATVRLASLRLAPVQITSWGHPETSGLPTIDYFLSAELFEPPGAQENYTERLVALPDLGCFVARSPFDPIAPDLAALGIDAQVPILVCAGTPFKYAPQHDWVLPAIARELERCQFIFFTYSTRQLSEKLYRRLRGVFERSGTDFDRYVRFVPWLSGPEFHGLMKRADVLLDTIGFSGFNIAVQAVECGLPIVTRDGRFMRGRLASGVLKRVGLSELISASEEGYVALAAKLAREGEYRQQVAGRMEVARQILYEDRAPMRALEDFLAATVGQ